MPKPEYITVTAIAGLGLALSGLACAAKNSAEPPQTEQLAQALAPPSRLEPPARLPGTARAILRNRMASHSRDMGDLMSAIMVLDYLQIEERAGGIAADASFARPLTDDATELNSHLPGRFFDLQDALREQAKTLQAAAKAMDAFKVANAYGALSETCVQCHSVYREGDKT